MIKNLRHIRSFLAVARVGNFTRAAAELRISQSALTVQIKQLESEVGATLFDRGKRKITLTQAGRDVLIPLERLLIDAEQVVSRTQELSGLQRGLVSVAVLPSLATHLIPTAVRQFTSAYPGVVVQVRDLVAEKIIEAVRLDEVDFGIGTQLRPERELKITAFGTDHLFAFLRADHRFARKRSLTSQELAGVPLILTGRDSSVRELVERTGKRQGLTLNIAYETNYMSSALGMAEAGLGIAILPKRAAGESPSVNIKRIPIIKPELSRKIVLIEKRAKTLSPAALEFMQATKQVAWSSHR